MTKEQQLKLESLGVNLDETLERFVGNEALYFKCLNKLIDDKNYQGMLDDISNQNAIDAFEHAHALKGVSANLGLDVLYVEMKVITEVFRAGKLDYDPENLERIKKAYKLVIDTIKDI